MQDGELLYAVGYWADENQGDDDQRPDPVELLRELGAQPAPKAAAYLRSGVELRFALGFSWCRFRCGVPDESMGCRDLTDGRWVWPEGLAHYVEVHQLPLPEPFLATMAENDWAVPALADHVGWETPINDRLAIDWYRSQREAGDRRR